MEDWNKEKTLNFWRAGRNLIFKLIVFAVITKLHQNHNHSHRYHLRHVPWSWKRRKNLFFLEKDKTENIETELQPQRYFHNIQNKLSQILSSVQPIFSQIVKYPKYSLTRCSEIHTSQPNIWDFPEIFGMQRYWNRSVPSQICLAWIYLRCCGRNLQRVERTNIYLCRILSIFWSK